MGIKVEKQNWVATMKEIRKRGDNIDWVINVGNSHSNGFRCYRCSAVVKDPLPFGP